MASRKTTTASLVSAALLPEKEAALAWREWRNSVDLDKLSQGDFALLPVLGTRLTRWLTDDPAEGILRGFLRRAWTENQVRLAALRAVVASLERGGCGPVLVSGSASVCLLTKDSSRPVFDLRVVVQRDKIAAAAAILESSGWRASGPLPDTSLLDRIPMVHFARQDAAGNHQSLMLQWRVLDVPAEKALACEREFLLHTQIAGSTAAGLLTAGPEHAFVAAVCGRFDFDADPIPWEIDAALLPVDAIDWRRWAELAGAYAPQAFDRLERLRGLGVMAPHVPRPAPPARRVRSRAERLLRRCYRASRQVWEALA